jgi:hypothetical protein
MASFQVLDATSMAVWNLCLSARLLSAQLSVLHKVACLKDQSGCNLYRHALVDLHT